jgi:glycosyltransferase involved in cell wall biosynthesis
MSAQPSTLLISPYFDASLPSGGVLYSMDMTREWLRRGRQVHVVCINQSRTLGDLSPYLETGQLILYPIAPEENGRFTHHPDDALYNTTRELIRTQRPELVHVHNIQGMLSAVAASIDADLPTVMTSLDFGLVCFNFCLYTGSPRICETPLSCSDCTECLRRTIRGPARVLGPMLPRAATRRIWPRFVRLDQIKCVRELHALMRRVLTSLDRIVALSPGMAERLRSLDAARGNVVFLAQGISPEKRVRPAKEICESLRLGYMGGLDPIKGFATIAQAANHLPAGLPLRIRVFGGDAMRDHIAQLPSRSRNYIEYHPLLFGRSLMEEHARIDAMLVPSIVHENSPSAALESLANGTPVLGSDEPGVSHLIVSDRNGWIIKAGDAKAWARAFIEAVQKPARIRRMQAIATYSRTTSDFVDDLERVEESVLPARKMLMPRRLTMSPMCIA